MSEIKETKKIQLSVLTQQVEDGMKKDELAAFYGLPMTQMTKVLQQAGLRIRKFHKPAFVLENDLEKSEENTTLQAISEENADTTSAGMVAEEVVATEEVIEVEVAKETAPTPWGSEEPATLEDLFPTGAEESAGEEKAE